MQFLLRLSRLVASAIPLGILLTTAFACNGPKQTGESEPHSDPVTSQPLAQATTSDEERIVTVREACDALLRLLNPAAGSRLRDNMLKGNVNCDHVYPHICEVAGEMKITMDLKRRRFESIHPANAESRHGPLLVGRFVVKDGAVSAERLN